LSEFVSLNKSFREDKNSVRPKNVPPY